MSSGCWADDSDWEEGDPVPWYLNGGNMSFVEENKEVIDSWMRDPAFWEELKKRQAERPDVVDENGADGEKDHEGASLLPEAGNFQAGSTAGPSLVLVTDDGNLQEDGSPGDGNLPEDDEQEAPETNEGNADQILVSRERFEQLVKDVEEIKKLLATSGASNSNGFQRGMSVAEGSSTTPRKRRAKGPLRCEDCDLTFKFASGKCIHMQAVHEGRRWTCRLCEATFTHPANWNFHMKHKHSSKTTGRDDPPENDGNVGKKVVEKDHQDESPDEALPLRRSLRRRGGGAEQ